MSDNLAFIPIFFVVFLFSLSFHEAAHAWTAEKFGDSTGRYLGRITLNPIPHIDIFGTIIFPLVGLLTGGLMFGWAKPVPVNTLQMRDRKLGDICTSAAGPISNFILAAVAFVIIRILLATGTMVPALMLTQSNLIMPAPNQAAFMMPMATLLSIMLLLNLTLGVFNLIPIPPLDGSHVLENLLPEGIAEAYARIRPLGFLLLIGLLWLGVLSVILRPVYGFVLNLLFWS